MYCYRKQNCVSHLYSPSLPLSAWGSIMLLNLFRHLGTKEVWATWREVHLRLHVLGCAAFCLLVFKYLLDELILILLISVCFAEYLQFMYSFFLPPFCFNTPGDPLYLKAFCGLSSKLHSLFSSLSCCFRWEMSSSRRSCFTLKEEKLYVPYYSRGKSCVFFLLCTPVFCLYMSVLTDSEVSTPSKGVLITLLIAL